jgi:unsaturated rhamnogalacturonyl hydrolase
MIVCGLLCIHQQVSAQKAKVSERKSPLEIVQTVADRIIRETPFRFQLVPEPVHSQFDFVHHVDFGKTFGLGIPAVAYALSQLESKSDTSFTIQVSHNDALKIWLNNKVVYQKQGARPLKIEAKERDIVLENEFPVTLKKGLNQILIKSETRGKEWICYLQPKGALIEERKPWSPRLSIARLPGLTAGIAKLSNWLVAGPFAVSDQYPANTVYGPEKGFEIGKLYSDGVKNITWTIPKIQVFADVINQKPYWGTYYSWNYHAGGVAWAMSNLADATGHRKYDEYSRRWTDFMLKIKPFIGYQVNEMNGFQSTHHQLFNTPLLDFTAAPAMPFIARLVKHKDFENRHQYEAFVKDVKAYVVHQQIRLPEGNFTRETPEKYTTWVDDMFMGIPFLVQASLETKDPKEKASLLDDAAGQVLAFNRQLLNPSTHLYHHAQYSRRKAKLPYWSRANGWGIWATTEVLLHLPASHPQRKTIMNAYLHHVNALVRLQDQQNGCWHNVLDRTDSYDELSGTAIISMNIARGINQGWLKKEKYLASVTKGWDYISSCIEPDGTVHKICVGTMSSENVNDYMNRPTADNDSHGLLGLLFAGIEIERLLEGKK